MKTFGKKATGARLERMKASPRFSETGFRNLNPIPPGLRSGAPMPSVSEFLCSGSRRVPAAPLPALDPRQIWLKPPETGLRASWLGHSTLLVEIDGLRILTDPVWGERASPVSIAGPKRFQPIPVRLGELPELDLVIVSHDHYDHLDYPTILELVPSSVPFVTSLGVGAHLEAWGVAPERIVELDWWESHDVGGGRATVTAAPSQHFSGRGVGSRNPTLWSSFAVRTSRHAFFFSGDTGLTAEYADVRQRLGPFDLVMLEVGAYHPAWGDIHLGPENALAALDLLGAKRLLPIHWGTFNLALHAWDEPAETLAALAPSRGVELLMPRLGEPFEPQRFEGFTPWWRDVAALETKATPVPPEASGAELAPAQLRWPLD
jgi:L-ascorbate metabolism protein UlaG (beta-lactamase superfamily)